MLTLGTVIASAAGAGPCPDGEACLVVHVVGTTNATRVVTADEIADWVDIPPSHAPYDLEPGGEAEVSAALSIRHLVEMISADVGGISVDGITYVSVQHPQRSDYVATLDQEHDHNLGPAGSNDFEDGLMPAVYVQGTNYSIGYIRPLRGSGDTNNEDNFQSNDQAPLEMTLHTSGEVLHPEISASSVHVSVGDPVTFTAQVDSGQELSYAWTFQGAASSSQEQPTVTWATPSHSGYLVSLSVTGADSSSGQSNYLRVVVDGPDPTKSPDPTETPDPTQTPGGHGGQDNPTTGPDTGDGDNAGGLASPSASPSPGADGSADDPGATTAPSPSASGDPAAGTGAGTVTGILLTGAELAPAEAGDPVTAPAARAGSDERSLRLPDWLLLVGGLAIALGLGASSELRAVRGKMRT